MTGLAKWAQRLAEDLSDEILQLSFGPLPGLSKSAAQMESELLVQELRTHDIKAWAAATKVCVSITRAQAWELVRALNAVKPKKRS